MSTQPSRLGIGTYLGDLSDEYSKRIQKTITHAVKDLKLTTVDTAINYRCQKSERDIGFLLKTGKLKREKICLLTKGGFIPYESHVPGNVSTYVLNKFQVPLKLQDFDIHDNMHCIHPRYLKWSFEQSLKNLSTDYIDVYFLHNPSFALGYLSRKEWTKQVMACFAYFEEEVKNKRCKYYGLATWHDLRVKAANPCYISLQEIYDLAQEKGFKHFKAIQLPINASYREFFTLENQKLDGKKVTVCDWALVNDFMVFGSAPLLQGHLLTHCKEVFKDIEWNDELGASQNLLSWMLKQNGITTTLVGTSSVPHLNEAARLLPKDQIPKFLR